MVCVKYKKENKNMFYWRMSYQFLTSLLQSWWHNKLVMLTITTLRSLSLLLWPFVAIKHLVKILDTKGMFCNIKYNSFVWPSFWPRISPNLPFVILCSGSRTQYCSISLSLSDWKAILLNDCSSWVVSLEAEECKAAWLNVNKQRLVDLNFSATTW